MKYLIIQKNMKIIINKINSNENNNKNPLLKEKEIKINIEKDNLNNKQKKLYIKKIIIIY